MSEGWISLHRKMIDWEWYDHIPTKVLFLHCLLKANHKSKTWRGVTINRGQFLTSLGNLSDETGLSIQNVRTAIRNLESTRELTRKPTNKSTTISITNYEKYQEANTQKTNKQHASNTQPTTTNNDNNDNKEYSADFETFWSVYPNKKDKKKAAKAFAKTTASLEEILLGLAKYKKHKEEWKEWKMATTWINGECWNDEYKTEQKTMGGWKSVR